jgi:hypothetical protein
MADSLSLDRPFQAMMERHKEYESAKILQFPLWPEPERGVPNEFSRSALFAAIQATDKRYLDNEEIASQGGFTITYTGCRLNQIHLDVFEGIMHLARGVTEGNKIHFTAHQLLTLIGRDAGSSQYKWVTRTFNHLTATSVAVYKDDARVFWGSLLPQGKFDGKKYIVEINRELVALFSRGFTRIDWEQRRPLRRKPLAQWLQLYYSSHAKPHPVSLEFLRDNSGSSTKSLRKFKQMVKAALGELRKIAAIKDFAIDDNNIVFVERGPSSSQQRFLASRYGIRSTGVSSFKDD